MSAGKATRHIAIRWFFITDMIQQKEVKVKDCSTKDMWGDAVTKPLQGGLFTKFRNLMQGIKTEDMHKYRKNYKDIIKQYELEDTCAKYDRNTSSNPQECVGE